MNGGLAMARSMKSWILVALVLATPGVAARVAAAQPVRFTGTTCTTPPDQHCPGENCPGDVVTSGGPVVEPTTNRNYFLDYPCDLKRSEEHTSELQSPC